MCTIICCTVIILKVCIGDLKIPGAIMHMFSCLMVVMQCAMVEIPFKKKKS